MDLTSSSSGTNVRNGRMKLSGRLDSMISSVASATTSAGWTGFGFGGDLFDFDPAPWSRLPCEDPSSVCGVSSAVNCYDMQCNEPYC